MPISCSMYAEALNELDGSYQIETWDNSGTHSISRDVDELKKWSAACKNPRWNT